MSHSNPPVPASVFDMDGQQVIQDEEHVGIVNGLASLGIKYREVAGLSGWWAPPFVSSNFSFDCRVNGERVKTSKWRWRPFQVSREGSLRGLSVSNRTTLIDGQRAVVLSLEFKNTDPQPALLEFSVLGWLDRTRDWDFARPSSTTETIPQASETRCTLRQGDLSIVLGLDVAGFRWQVAGNLACAALPLGPGESKAMHFVLSLGEGDAPATWVSRIQSEPAAAVRNAELDYSRRVQNLFERVPQLESDNAELVSWFNRSLIHLLMNRWDVPEFVLHPYYSTGSVKGGCVANYLWNFGEVWEILPLVDPSAVRTHIKQFLLGDLRKHFLFNPITGEASGPWYMINQEKIVGLTFYYVLLTGDTDFLRETVDGKTIQEHMLSHAQFGDDLEKPISLIDYGASNSHLELRRKYAYNHVMPDLNARRYATFQRAATLCELSGRSGAFLRARADMLKKFVKERLWDQSINWFYFEDGTGRRDLRYTVQMFKLLGGGVLDDGMQRGLLAHLNETEFLSPYGLHSISKTDPAFDQLDIDNGGGGICTSFAPQIIERLFQANEPQVGAGILRRILWWGESMPYWGDSIVANARDYRRDTPLQCALDGAAGAQSIMFGVFGVRMKSEFDLEIAPAELPFARRLALRGLRLRDRVFDIQVEAGRFTVRAPGLQITAAVGQKVLFSFKDGTFHSTGSAEKPG